MLLRLFVSLGEDIHALISIGLYLIPKVDLVDYVLFILALELLEGQSREELRLEEKLCLVDVGDFVWHYLADIEDEGRLRG